MAKRGYLTTSDVGRICQVTAVTVGNWIRSGKLSASRVPGGNYRVNQQALAHFLRQADIPLPPSLTRTQPRVLIISHAPHVVGRISDVLTDSHWLCDIDTANDCFTAGAKVIDTEPDLVIVDMLMPGIDPDVCQQVRQTSAWNRARVIALVVHEQPLSLTKAQILDPDCCLPQAFTAEQLRSAIFGLLFGKDSSADDSSSDRDDPDAQSRPESHPSPPSR
ncbi:MAG: helix-turn-helix domain-containing protein [Actinobacteria bacterium]|nr:helix-turn-helix domain-containing protein [Actinomycetota bacterium]